MKGDLDVGKTLKEQCKEVEAQTNLAMAIGVDPDQVVFETGRSVNSIQVGYVSIAWNQNEGDGQSHFDALIEIVKLGIEAKWPKEGALKKPQPAVVASGAQKTA